MQKLKINIGLILPDVPNERDACLNRIITALQGKDGIEAVHVVPESKTAKAQLCFHYNPNIISVDKVQHLAALAGAEITSKYHHLLLEVQGIRHQRQTRLIETYLNSMHGILSAAASASGVLFIEFDATETNAEVISEYIHKLGLKVVDSSGEQAQLTTQAGVGEAPPVVLDKQAAAQKKHEHRYDEKKHVHEDGAHEHSHTGIFGSKTELIFSLICGLLLGIGFLLSFNAGINSIIPIICYMGAYFFGGYFTAKEALQTVARGGFEIDFLMLVAAIGAAIIGSWTEGALLLFLFSLGHALEHFAMEKARKSIAALSELAPKTALLKQENGTIEVKVEVLQKGDVIVVKPNTKIPADGVVVSGSGSVNQAPITGESIPVDKMPILNPQFNSKDEGSLDAQYKVFAGSINGNSLLEIKVIKETTDSTLARLIKMVNEAQTQKSPTQQFTDKFEKYFVPAVLILVVILCFAYLVIDEPFKTSFYRAMAVLVAASPCALAISTPSAVLSGVARAARAGVLIKGGKPLENLGELTVLAFDKTGTLTEGKPRLTQIIPLEGMQEEDLLKKVVAVEALSDHPIGKAIVRDGMERLGDSALPEAHDIEAVLGKGIKAIIGNDAIFIGNLALFESLDAVKPSINLTEKVQQLEIAGNTTMVVRQNETYIGLIAVMDRPRKEARQTIVRLSEVGIRRMVMLSGDNQEVAATIAKEVGLKEANGGLLPEQKVAAVMQLMQEETKVAMVGDGVNDAPAMAKSSVGIAMGAAGSDVALETADIALMGDKLDLLPFAIGLSRQAKRIIKQNLIVSLGVVAMLIPLTILNITGLGLAVLAHEGSTLVVVLNALRLLAYKEEGVKS